MESDMLGEFSPEEMAAALAVWESDAIQEGSDALRERALALFDSAEFQRVFGQPHVKLALSKMAALSELPMSPMVMLVMLSTCALAMAALED